jgi:hypothetical protein
MSSHLTRVNLDRQLPLAGSESTGVSHPLLRSPSQSYHLGGRVQKVLADKAVEAACAVITNQQAFALPPHPGLQVPKAGWPFPQASAAVLGKRVAAVLHAPQLATSVRRFTSQPLAAFLSQSAYLYGAPESCAHVGYVHPSTSNHMPGMGQHNQRSRPHMCLDKPLACWQQ